MTDNLDDPIRLAEQPFNNCPGRKVVMQALNDAQLLANYEPADAPEQFWDNAEDTIVLKKTYGSMPTFYHGVRFGQVSLDCGADELHMKNIDGDVYVRMWWD